MRVGPQVRILRPIRVKAVPLALSRHWRAAPLHVAPEEYNQLEEYGKAPGSIPSCWSWGNISLARRDSQSGARMSSRICFGERCWMLCLSSLLFPMNSAEATQHPWASWDFLPVTFNTCPHVEICNMCALRYLTLTSHFSETKSVYKVYILERVRTPLVLSLPSLHLCSWPQKELIGTITQT